ncbi:PmoA family protein [bacterium]|nr:PmoA family protein [bacterium]
MADHEPGTILEVQAGPHDRKDVVVSYPCTAGDGCGEGHALFELGADGKPGVQVPCQCVGGCECEDEESCECECELTWIVPELKAGESKRYIIGEAEDACGCGCCGGDASGVSIDYIEGEKADVKVGGKLFTSYIVKEGIARPYCYPVLGPGGAEVTECAKKDHPHHRSLYVAQGSVNGFDNWSEMDGHASSVNRALEVLAEGPVFGEFVSVNDWVSPKGQQLLQEITCVRVYNHPDNCRIMDWDITWLAAYGGVFLGDTKEAGTLSVRMIETAHARNGGTFRNSFGGVNEEECWGKKAEWVDYYGPIASGIGGIAIFDHPENLRYPTTWHVRNYGLFTANQWGLHDFTDDWSQRGDYALEEGDALNFTFRLYIHDGDTFHADVAGKYLDFIYPPKVKAVQ